MWNSYSALGTAGAELMIGELFTRPGGGSSNATSRWGFTASIASPIFV